MHKKTRAGNIITFSVFCCYRDDAGWLKHRRGAAASGRGLHGIPAIIEQHADKIGLSTHDLQDMGASSIRQARTSQRILLSLSSCIPFRKPHLLCPLRRHQCSPGPLLLRLLLGKEA